MFISQVSAYVPNQTQGGKAVHWSRISSTIDIFANSENRRGFSTTQIQSIVDNSIAEWNGNSRITLRKNETTAKDQEGLNELYFSNDPTIFNGTAVIGVTLVSFRDKTGEITEADILINDNRLEMDDLGNVVTHELGHFVGLGHSLVQGSTMFYALSRGQSAVSDDDKAGIYATYPSGNTSLGSLSGSIIGGKNLSSVFGAHVQAISVTTGKVMGASISELSGKFNIAGLPKNDQYLIYTSPIVKEAGLPNNYASVRSDFCESSRKYRGSFFQSCGSSSEGFPQAVKLNSSSLDVGNITIRCSLDTPPEYIQNKNVNPAVFDMNTYTQSGIGGSFVGFFTTSEIQRGTVEDYFKLDLSNVNWGAISDSNSLYLELKVNNQAFYSGFKPNVNLKRGSGVYDTTPYIKYVEEDDGRLNIDTIKRIAINRSIPSDNEFEIKIVPEAMDSEHFLSGILSGYTKDDFFPSSLEFQDNLYFYLVTATIVRRDGDVYTLVSSKNDTLTDNSQCPDAANTYSLTNYSAKKSSSNSDRKSVAACGTVDMGNGGTGSGPGGFMVGLMLSFIISYALSRYSKMA